MKNILFMHGGGPTAVINASLSGSIRELYDRKFDGDILYAPFGTGGLMKGKINKNDLVEIKKAICSYENVSMKLLKRFGLI